MKQLLLSLLLIFPLPGLFAQERSMHMRGSEYCAYSKQMRTEIAPIDLRSANSPRHSFDVLDYNLDLDIYQCYTSPYPKSFDAQVIVKFRVDTALTQIKLNAVKSSLLIHSVGMAGASFTHGPDTLTIQLDNTYPPGAIVEVSIDYSHKNVTDNAFYAKNGFVFTDCEPQGARKWFPCYDQPSDKATLTLKARVPSNVKLGSNGRLSDSLTVADTTWFTWISRDPVPTYLMVITSRENYNLDIVQWTNPETNETKPIRFYFNPGEDPSDMEAMIVPLADFYTSVFGEHPFEKDGFATLSPQFSWGGMENQSLTSLCPDCWESSLVAHEFAHQWFGDMITCATWSDIFLNEGFATFSEALWTGEISGYQAYKNELIGNANYYLSQNPGWAISNPDWAFTPPSSNVLFNYAITYMKASCVMPMYRHVVGDSLFFASLKAYTSDTNFRYKTSTIPDFADKMSEVADEDMHWFFDQWLYQPNHPVYQNVYSFEESNNGKWYVHFRANQIQNNAPFFKMPLTLRIGFLGIPDKTLVVMNDVNNQEFTWLFDQKPVSLVFDPGNDILLKQASTMVTVDKQPDLAFASMQTGPNPAKETVKVDFHLKGSSGITIQINDLNGKLLFNKDLGKVNDGDHSEIVNLRNISSGTYILSLKSETASISDKLVVIK